MKRTKFTPKRITHLKENEVFVFGSNENGYHYGGAALLAHDKFGALWGKGVGHYGKSYAIPTLNRYMTKVSVEKLKAYVEDFVTYVRLHPELTFYLTPIGCGIAAWSVKKVKSVVWAAIGESCPENLVLPQEFLLNLKK